MEEQKKVWIRDVKGIKPAFVVNEDVGEKFIAKRKNGEPVYIQVDAPPTVENMKELSSKIDLTSEELKNARARIAELEGKVEKPKVKE